MVELLGILTILAGIRGRVTFATIVDAFSSPSPRHHDHGVTPITFIKDVMRTTVEILPFNNPLRKEYHFLFLIQLSQVKAKERERKKERKIKFIPLLMI